MRDPRTLEDARKEIDRLRAELRAFLKLPSLEHPDSKRINDNLILYGDSRPGEEFRVI